MNKDQINHGTNLYRDHVLNYDYGSFAKNELMRKVWSATPWMLEVFTGPSGGLSYREMYEWCVHKFGKEASPINGIDGHWQRGCATVEGWTWYGFATEGLMKEFIEKWEKDEQ